MASGGLSVEMLPARHGDGLWVEWGDDGDRHRMIIDGGPQGSYEHLRTRLEALDEDDRHIDLLVVSHIDLDHIETPIELLRTPPPGVTFSDIWFNDWMHLPTPDAVPEAASDGKATGDGEYAESTRGAKQGEFLGALLKHRELPWNERFGKGPVVVPDRGPLPRVSLPGDLDLVLLSPDREKLADLRPVWEKVLAEADMTPGDRARAFQLLEERMGPVAETDRGGRKIFGRDGSEANGSSIAFIAEYRGERWLFAGDAHEDLLRKNLVRYRRSLRPKERKVALTGFKVPHHGSVQNISSQLLDLVEVERFLISTNGAYFKHPDEACVNLLIEKSKRPELVFNYRTEFTEPWASGDGFTSRYTDDPSDETTRTANVPAQPDGAPVPESVPDIEAPPAVRPPTELQVRVFHGSFDRADSTIIVGHYEATPLAGAEGAVDLRYDGRLTDRLVRDQYPGPIGSTPLFVRPPRMSHPAKGVLIIGLGEYGELTANNLVDAVQSSLVHHALNVADDHPSGEQPVALAISSVLVGATGDQALTVRAAVRSIVMGVVKANEAMLEGDAEPRCQYTTLDFWERRAPEAELALLALGRQKDEENDGDLVEFDPDALPEGVVVDPDLHKAKGQMIHSLPIEVDQHPWRRIRVSAPQSKPDEGEEESPFLELGFAVDGRLAGVGSRRHPVERKRLERLLSRSSDLTEPDDALYTTLYGLLLPNELKWDLQSAADIQLEVDVATADIPWEMLAARNSSQGTREALALRAPFTRRLNAPMVRTVRGEQPRALVIGNPPSGPNWPQLPGAYDEAVAVVTALENAGLGDLTTSLLYPPDRVGGDAEASTAEIEDSLFADDYRIVHIAAHGVFDPDDPSRSGAVIGPDAFITPALVSQLRPVPDLVFLNCCHLGTVGPDHDGANRAAGVFNKLGASLAVALIDAGVRAVVAAGWAVEDRAATAFATHFYRHMTRLGATFAEAVFAGRQAAFRTAPNSSTWGAYQCYGDSGFRLGVQRRTEVPSAPSTSRELLRRVEYLIARFESKGVASGSGPEYEQASQELAALTSAARERGWAEPSTEDGGQVAEHLARAHAEAGNYDRATDWYNKAVEHPRGTASLQALEQRANMKDRYAARLVKGEQVTRSVKDDARKLTEEAEADLLLLERLSSDPGRGTLLAGHHKRAATVLDGPQRSSALKKAADSYRDAYTRAINADPDTKPSDVDPFALVNYVQLETIRSRLGGSIKSRVTREELAVVKRESRRRLSDSSDDYWEALGRANSRLALALVDNSLPRSVRSIADRYDVAFERRSTARQRASTVEHLEDLAALHPVEAHAAALDELVDELKKRLGKGT